MLADRRSRAELADEPARLRRAFERTYNAETANVRVPRAWYRFVGGELFTDESSLGHLTKDSGVEEIITHSLYCDTSPLPALFGRRLLEFVNLGGYELTHAVLAHELLHDNKCMADVRLTAASSKARSSGGVRPHDE